MRPRLAARVLLALIRGYRTFISPVRPPACRYLPSCSEYTVQAIAEHGLWRGSVLGARRIGRCHPLHAGGYDPVPPAGAGDEPVPAGTVPGSVPAGTVGRSESSEPKKLLRRAG